MSRPPLSRSRRAVLVAPASSDRKARKALATAVDEVVLDLEDAVAPEGKAEARAALVRLVSEAETDPRCTAAISVRVNGRTTRWHDDDMTTAGSLSGLSAVVVPKVESADDVLVVAERLDNPEIGVTALVETARGIENITAICAASRQLDAVVIGYADLGAEIGRSPTARPELWLHVQDTVLLAARAAGVAVIDGPYLGIADDADFRRSTTWVRDLGFDGKWVIHPSQIATATATFTPDDDAVEHAERVLAALDEAQGAGRGAVAMGGMMLDEAVAVAARRVLARAGRP